MSTAFDANSRVHVMGCGGAGMSALVRLLVGRGAAVSGCDRAASITLRQLANEGAAIFAGHGANHLDGVDFVIASPAVAPHHPELQGARDRGIAVLTRPALMAALSSLAPVVAFAGTHGKTTTSSMAAMIWDAAELRPSWLIGAPVRGLGPNGHWGQPSALLVEADESYGAFGEMTPAALGLLNVDPDHLDHYGDVASLECAFVDLVDRTVGPVSAWVDHDGARRVEAKAHRRIWRVGHSTRNEVVVSEERFTRTGSQFLLTTPSGAWPVTLRVPGALNVANAAVAGAVAISYGLPGDAVVRGLGRFVGAPRRFELRGVFSGTTVVDDYAHLPSEVAATIAAARSAGYQRIAAVFQPHRVSRTAALAASFAGAFRGVHDLVVTDIYAAGEANPDALTGVVVANAVAHGVDAPVVHYAESLETAASHLEGQLGQVDLILVLGAGDVHRVIDFIAATERS